MRAARPLGHVEQRGADHHRGQGDGEGQQARGPSRCPGDDQPGDRQRGVPGSQLTGEVHGGPGLVAEDEGGQRDQQLGEGDHEQHVAGPLPSGPDRQAGAGGTAAARMAALRSGTASAERTRVRRWSEAAAVEKAAAVRAAGDVGLDQREGEPGLLPVDPGGDRFLDTVGTTWLGGRRDRPESSRQTGRRGRDEPAGPRGGPGRPGRAGVLRPADPGRGVAAVRGPLGPDLGRRPHPGDLPAGDRAPCPASGATSSARTWLLAIARRTCADDVRRRSRLAPAGPPGAGRDPGRRSRPTRRDGSSWTRSSPSSTRGGGRRSC